MARDWRRAVLAAFAAAMLGCACALDALAQQAEEQLQEDEKTATDAKTKKKQDPAEAQRAIEAAFKQLQAGKAAQAVQAVSATVAGGNLPPAIMAKALYVRGVAYRRQGQSAQAISDLTSALWLKGGLGDEEREQATKERSAAYADAGLAEPGESQPAPKTKSAGSGSTFLGGIFGGFGASQETPSPAPAPKATPAPVGREEPPPSSAPKTSAPKTAVGGSTFLGGIFGGFGASQETPSPAPAPKATPAPVEREEPPPSPAPKASAPKTAVGAPWSSKTDVQEPAPKAQPPKAQPPKAQPPKAQPPKAQPSKAQPPKAQPPKAQPSKAQPPEAQPPKAQPSKAQPSKAQPSKAQPPKAQPPKTQAVKTTPPPVPSAKKLGGSYLVQLAAMRTEAEARALAAKAKREHGSLLASRGQSVDRTAFGNMGAFYLVRFGPFASAQESQAVCARLRGGGIDCLPVSQ